MLDKSIEFRNIIMRIEVDKLLAVNESILPEGFSFSFFSGTENIKDWCRIETSVFEFTSEEDAQDYYTKAYVPYINELKNRCLFVTNQENIPIATATAWFADSELGYQACLHWVAVCPEYQGIGIGKTIVKKALKLLCNLEPDCAVWLHTQTWSYVAIGLYHKLGFNLLKMDTLANMNTRSGNVKIYQNDYLEALEVLKHVMDERHIIELMDTAV